MVQEEKNAYDQLKEICKLHVALWCFFKTHQVNAGV